MSHLAVEARAGTRFGMTTYPALSEIHLSQSFYILCIYNVYQFVNDLAFFREIDPQFESTGFQSPKPSLNLEVKLFEMMWSFVQLVAVRQTKNTKHLYTISNSDMFSRKLPYVLVECGFPVCFPRTSAKPEASSSTSSCTQTDTAWSTVTVWRLEGTISLHILSIPQV